MTGTGKKGGQQRKLLVIAALAALVAGVAVLQCSGSQDSAPSEAPVASPPAARPAGPAPFLTPPAEPAPPAPAAAAPSAAGIDPVACAACEKKHIAAGDCEPDSGCEGLSGTDQELCENLLACQRRTNCWVKHPLDCLCGSASGVDCAQGAADGACRAEIQAATKTTDPVKNGTLFFDPTLPAGRANRLIACAYDNCQSVCAPKATQ
jgi:hypothetical protein